MASHGDAAPTYWKVFGALAGLTLLTVGVSFVPLGPFHLAVALLIAATKGVLVVLFFMHLWESKRLLWLAAFAGFFWLAIMMGLTLSDYVSRDWLGHPHPALTEQDQARRQ